MTRLSNRQHPLLKVFVAEGHGFVMSLEDAATFDQRPFRSLLIQVWIEYRPSKKGFVLTEKGRSAWREFHETNIFRHDVTKPLTAYFDPGAYGIAPTRNRRVFKSKEIAPKRKQLPPPTVATAALQ